MKDTFILLKILVEARHGQLGQAFSATAEPV